MNCAIVLAGGKSSRMGPNIDKAFLNLESKPVLAHSLQVFQDCADIDGIVLVARKDRLDAARAMVQMFGISKVQTVVGGGAARQTSVYNGLTALDSSATIVAVHDGARPYVTPELVSKTIRCAKRYGSGVAAAKVTDTIKEVERGHVIKRTVDRERLWAVQTPQTFKVSLLREAFARVRKKGAKVTDEASAVELLGKDVHIVPSTWVNVKITTPDDLIPVAALAKV